MRNWLGIKSKVNRSYDYDRPYEKYKKHLQKLVNFGSLSKFMMKKYLKNFITVEHGEALQFNRYSMAEAIVDNLIENGGFDDVEEWD